MEPRLHDRRQSQATARLLARAVSAHHRFTLRHREVLARVFEGEKIETVAWSLGISRHTVDAHLREMRRRSGVTSIRELLLQAAALCTSEHHGKS